MQHIGFCLTYTSINYSIYILLLIFAAKRIKCSDDLFIEVLMEKGPLLQSTECKTVLRLGLLFPSLLLNLVVTTHESFHAWTGIAEFGNYLLLYIPIEKSFHCRFTSQLN